MWSVRQSLQRFWAEHDLKSRHTHTGDAGTAIMSDDSNASDVTMTAEEEKSATKLAERIAILSQIDQVPPSLTSKLPD